MMGRWGAGASYFILCGIAYAAAFVIALIPLTIIDALGIYHPTNWNYWLVAALIAPWIAGEAYFRGLMGSIGEKPPESI